MATPRKRVVVSLALHMRALAGSDGASGWRSGSLQDERKPRRAGAGRTQAFGCNDVQSVKQCCFSFHGPAAQAVALSAAGAVQSDIAVMLGFAGRSTRSSFNVPPQWAQVMGLGAGASLSVLSGLAAKACAISTR
jgi:hypothetical protein